MPNSEMLGSIFGFLPTATKTLSHSILSLFALLLFVKSTTALFFTTLTPVTFEFSLKLMPCLLRIFKNSLDISLSIPGMIWSKYSTTVTFEPSLFQTLESSKPIYPPPITTKFLGVLSKANAPVEETIIFSSAIILTNP